MSANRPLSKERREELENLLRCNYSPLHIIETLREVLQAEAFWREAVKNAPEFAEYGDSGECLCTFCGGELANQRVAHKPDCPWLLANQD